MTDSKVSKSLKISFDRNIDLFLSDKIKKIPSDYQFLSLIEYFIEKCSLKDFKDYLSKKAETTYDTRDFFKSFFFKRDQYIEEDFKDFLFDFFQIVCPNNLPNLTLDNFEDKLKEYQELFFDSPQLIKAEVEDKDKNKPEDKPIYTFNQKAKFFWLSLGFTEADYQPSITSKNYKEFDIEKVSILHNLCVFFSYKLIFVYFKDSSADSRKDPKIIPAGCLNSENTIFVGLRLDNKKFVLTLPKPNSQESDDIKLDESKELIGISKEAQIYNLHIAHCCLFGHKNESANNNLFAQICNFNASKVSDDGFEIEITSNEYDTSKSDFILPIFDQSNQILFRIITPKDYRILDVCYDSASIYVIGCYYFGKSMHVQIFEGCLGDQYLDDMYLCAEEIFESEEFNESIFGKISLLKSIRVKVPIAIILYKNKEDRYQILIYVKPQKKYISKIEESVKLSNNFYYPSSLRYHIQWKLYRDIRPIPTHSKIVFKGIDFDGMYVFFNTDKKVYGLKLDNFDQLIKKEVADKQFENSLTELENPRKNDDDDLDEKTKEENKEELKQMLSINERSKIIGVEINNLFFLLKGQKRKEIIYYHPARNNFYLKSAIKSAFYRYKENMPKLLSELNDEGFIPFGIINVMIDVGYKGDINELFNSNPLIPGIYFQYKSKKDKVGKSYKETTKEDNEAKNMDDDDDDDGKNKQKKGKKGKKNANTTKNAEEVPKKKAPTVNAKILFTIDVAFANSGMIVGKDVHRTKCQLAAAYALSTYFTIYGPALKVSRYEPMNEVYDNWTLEKAEEMLTNLVATYSVLLEMRDDNEFNVALKTLLTTKAICDDFNLFYDDFKKIWDLI